VKPFVVKLFVVKPFAVLAVMSLLVLPAFASARVEKVPTLAIEGSCHDAESYGLTEPEQTYKNCMLDENVAKQQLEKNWSQYKAATRRQCIAAGAFPSPSYVELLTCIEMTEEILTPPYGDGGGASVGRVPGGTMGSPPPRPQISPGPRAMPR
jgi:hypothetical protein